MIDRFKNSEQLWWNLAWAMSVAGKVSSPMQFHGAMSRALMDQASSLFAEDKKPQEQRLHSDGCLIQT